LGSSRFNGSVKIEESGSGGQSRSVNGFSDIGFTSGLFGNDPMSSAIVSASVGSSILVGSSEGGGDDGPASAFADIVQSLASLSTHPSRLRQKHTFMLFVTCHRATDIRSIKLCSRR
jgi:hypothetical protein